MGRCGHPKEGQIYFLDFRGRADMVPGVVDRTDGEFVSAQTADGNRKRWSAALTAALILACLCFGVPAVQAQSSPEQSSGGQAPATQPAQNATQNNDIPDAPTVQPSAEPPEPPPIPKPEEKKKPVERDPWTNQPINGAGTTAPGTNQPGTSGLGTSDSGTGPGDGTSAPPPMPPVKTVPPGSAKPGPSGQEQLYTLTTHATFVQVPVIVKDRDGRRVDGLLSTDFTVKENGAVQKLTFFTADPFALSVAIVLDLGMADAAVQKVNQTFPALVGAFAPYDEVAIYTYSSTVSQVHDFAGPTPKLTALLNQMKTERGRNNGVPILGGPLAPMGPIINGVPVESPTAPVNTPPKVAHVLNDAILQAALDLSKRDRSRRKIILVISDGREFESKASYRDVLKVLLTHGIQVKAVALEGAALPLYGKVERLHLPGQGYGNLLPRYTYATAGDMPFSELTRNAIEEIYGQIMSEARNEYTLGYTPLRPKTPTTTAYRSIEVLVDHPGLKISAKDGYYPVPAAAR
jgi:VWFA-related protein